jgi:biofilm PGA synthesis N-glycosyltransferase PgaC
MRWVFWSAFALVAYTYAGYLCWLWLRARLFPWPVRHSPQEPQVSVVMVVRNEEQVLQRKLQNILTLDYPEGLCQVVVVSDGSTDGTERILSSHAADPRVHVIMNQLPRGKASGLNDAIAMASGEIIVFTDARQQIEPGAIRLLAENFTDPEVGCVSGALMLGDPGAGETGKGMGLYWGIEKKIRELESAAGSVVGATGAIYSVRREFLSSVPEGTILDDVYIPMQVARQGKRIVFEDRARAWDTPDLGKGREFARKVRTLSGNYQLLQLAPWLLTGENPVRFEFVSHKLLRLVVPFALLILLITCVFLPGPFFKSVLALQLAFYALGLLALLKLSRGPLASMADAALTFVMLNGAAAMAFVNFMTGRKAVWMASPRPRVHQV